MKILELNIGLRRPLLWNFFIADVDWPILGIDLLTHYKLLIDPYNRILIDSETNIKISCQREITTSSKISAIPPSTDEFSAILQEFPNLVSPSELLFLPPVASDVRHHICTTGPPVSAHARRLSPAQLEIAKEEIPLHMKQGIYRPSSSPWASPLHVVPKPDGGQ